MKEGRRMLCHEDLSSRSRPRIPDQFMESELAKKNIKDHGHYSRILTRILVDVFPFLNVIFNFIYIITYVNVK